jgi:uncharacterized circularly permuted ATP-grasp superfamily protein
MALGLDALETAGSDALASRRGEIGRFFDEMTEPGGVRPPYRLIDEWLQKLSPADLELRRREAELIFRRTGITFAVYGEGGDPERLIPFDIVPRVLGASECSACVED